MEITYCQDQLVEAFFFVAPLVPEVVFFAPVMYFVREVAVVFCVLPLVVRDSGFFAFVDDLPFAEGFWESSEASAVAVTFLRALLREDAPFCSGLSAETPC